MKCGEVWWLRNCVNFDNLNNSKFFSALISVPHILPLPQLDDDFNCLNLLFPTESAIQDKLLYVTIRFMLRGLIGQLCI